MFRKQWHTFIRMRLRATCSLLLLLLVGLQSSAVACAVRCQTMTSLGSPSRMSGMANCQMASQSGFSHQEMAAFVSSRSCAGHLCMNDWTFLQNQVAHDLRVASSSAIVASHAVAPIPIASRLQFGGNRSTRSIRFSIPSFPISASSLVPAPLSSEDVHRSARALRARLPEWTAGAWRTPGSSRGTGNEYGRPSPQEKGRLNSQAN